MSPAREPGSPAWSPIGSQRDGDLEHPTPTSATRQLPGLVDGDRDEPRSKALGIADRVQLPPGDRPGRLDGFLGELGVTARDDEADAAHVGVVGVHDAARRRPRRPPRPGASALPRSRSRCWSWSPSPDRCTRRRSDSKGRRLRRDDDRGRSPIMTFCAREAGHSRPPHASGARRRSPPGELAGRRCGEGCGSSAEGLASTGRDREHVLFPSSNRRGVAQPGSAHALGA